MAFVHKAIRKLDTTNAGTAIKYEHLGPGAYLN